MISQSSVPHCGFDIACMQHRSQCFQFQQGAKRSSTRTGKDKHKRSHLHNALCSLLACCLLHTPARLAVPTSPGGFLALFRAVPARAGGVSGAHFGAIQQHCEQQRGYYLANLQSLHTCRGMSLSETPRRFVHLRAPQLHDYSCEGASQCADF